MPRFKGQSANFSAGVLSPGAQDRIESAVWNAGAETLENLLVRRGGGVRTRPGLRLARVTDTIAGRALPQTREVFTSPWQHRTFTGARVQANVVAQGSQGFDKTPETTTTFANPAELDFARPGSQAGRTPWDISPNRISSAEGGGVSVYTGLTNAVGFAGTLDGLATPTQYATTPDITEEEWRQRRWALKLLEVTLPPWPIRSLTLQRLLIETSSGANDYQGKPALTWYATGGMYYAAFALWGEVAGIPGQWLSLTGMGAYANVLQVLAGAFSVIDQVAGTKSIELAPMLIRPGGARVPVDAAWLRANGADAFVPPDTGAGRTLAIAWSRIALVALGLHRRSLGVSGTEPGEVSISIGGISAGFDTQDGSALQGTDAAYARRAAGEQELAAPTPDRSRLRLVEWTPAPGVHLLCTFHQDGVEVTEVTPAGKPLVVRAKEAIDLRVLEGRMHEAVFAAHTDVLYIFHEALDAPKVLTWAGGSYTVADWTLTAVEVSAGVSASVPHEDNDYADASKAYWGGAGEGVRSGTFVFGRLALLGSGRYPNMIAFSKVNDYSTFVPDDNAAAGDVDEPFHALTAGAENLHAGLLGRRLVAFGENAEYFLPAEEVSGRSLAFRKTSQHGSPRGGRALNVGDAIVFRQASPDGTVGVDMRMMVFSDEESGFRTPSLAPFSEHLVKDVDAYAYQPGAQDGGARLWCVRRDGQLSVLSIDRAAQVNAWSECRLPEQTEAFEVASIADRVFVLVRMGEVVHLAELSYADDTGSVLDLATVIPSWTPGNVTLPEALAEVLPETLTVVSSMDPPFTVERRGRNVAIPETATLTPGARVEIGIPVQWTIRTLPFVPRTSTGSAVAVQKTRVLRTMVDFETTPLDEVPFLPILRVRSNEVARPSRIEWPRRVELEDSRGLWLPFVPLPYSDTERLVQVKLGARRGWRNRTTVAIRGRMPCAIVGLSWMVAGSG